MCRENTLRRQFWRCLVFCLPLCFTSALVAATYYVSVDGRDGNRGSEQAPFRHLSRAASAARHPGDTVVVLDGTYDNEGVVTTPESVRSVVSLENSGTAGRPITFRALHRGRAILDAGSTSPSGCNGAWAYFDLRNSSWIVIEGFVIRHGCFNGIRSNGAAHDVLIKWNEFGNIGNWNNPAGPLSPSGIYLNHTEFNFTFDGNIFHDIGGGSNVNQQHAIYTAASLVKIVNNIFFGITHGWAIQTAGGDGLLIANNTFAFANPHRTGQIVLWDNEKPGSLANITIRNNVFYEPLEMAVVTVLRGPVSGACNIDHNVATVKKMFDGGSPCNVRDNRTGVDPKLVKTSAPYDFHLLPGSPAIGAGVPIPEVSHDFNGVKRAPNPAPDAGALAFVAEGNREHAGVFSCNFVFEDAPLLAHFCSRAAVKLLATLLG